MQPTIKPFPKQHLAWKALRDPKNKYIVYGGGAGGGKSWLGCEWLMTSCYFFPNTRYFIGREELSRLMKSSYVTFMKVCQHHKIPETDWKLNGQYNYIQFKNGSRIDLLDVAFKPSDPLFERFGSLEYTSGWLEEAGEINFGAFDVLKSRVGRHMNKDYNIPSKIFITCNPKKNWLYKVVYKPYKQGNLDPKYAFIQSLYNDNPHTADEYGENLSEIRDAATKQRLMLGDWEYENDANSLMDYQAILDLFTNPQIKSYDKYISADIARYGQDKTVILLWEGLNITQIHTLEKQSLQITATKIRDLARENKVPVPHIVIDEDGVGGGVVDQIPGSKGFINNSSALTDPLKPDKENYKNLKSQCYFMLADLIMNRKISIKTNNERIIDQITEELEQVKRHNADTDQKLQIVPKDQVKDLLGRSPDYSDAMAMRMFFDLKPSIADKIRTITRRRTSSNIYSPI